MTTRNDKASLVKMFQCSKNKEEEYLVEALALLGGDSIEQILGSVDAVTNTQISNYAIKNFDTLDCRPNPVDRFISRHEIVDALMKSFDVAEQILLVTMWLRFDEIRACHQDFTGMEAAFDTQISYTDLEVFGNSLNN